MVLVSTEQDLSANSSVATKATLLIATKASLLTLHKVADIVENGNENFSKLLVTKLASSSESSVNTVHGPSEVIAKIEQLLLDTINQAEMELKQLPQYRTKMMVLTQNFDRMQDLRRQSVLKIADEEKLQGLSLKPTEYQPFKTGSSEISSPLVLNERPGVRYFCCDRFFKCHGRNLVAREIWPSDDGCIELNRKELRRFIMKNETKGSNLCKVLQSKGYRNPTEPNSTAISINSNENMEAKQQFNMRRNEFQANQANICQKFLARMESGDKQLAFPKAEKITIIKEACKEIIIKANKTWKRMNRPNYLRELAD